MERSGERARLAVGGIKVEREETRESADPVTGEPQKFVCCARARARAQQKRVYCRSNRRNLMDPWRGRVWRFVSGAKTPFPQASLLHVAGWQRTRSWAATVRVARSAVWGWEAEWGEIEKTRARFKDTGFGRPGACKSRAAPCSLRPRQNRVPSVYVCMYTRKTGRVQKGSCRAVLEVPTDRPQKTVNVVAKGSALGPGVGVEGVMRENKLRAPVVNPAEHVSSRTLGRTRVVES